MRIVGIGMAAFALGCAGAAPHSAPHVDPARAELVHRLCEPLPPHAYDCVVSWPASIAPAHRAAVATASEGASWIGVEGVRAFAICADRPAEDGPVAVVVSALIDTATDTPESVAERLPMHVRWADECEDPTDDCAGFLARAEGDRLILTRRVQRPLGTPLDVAHLACGAIADGAEEARAMLESDDALVRELDVALEGLSIITRRPAGRGGVAREHRTWTELDLAVRDEHIEHESDLRLASIGRPIDPERVDVTNEEALDRQLAVRQQRADRSHETDAFVALARLAQRGFEAHPSRPDLALVAIDAGIQAGAYDVARTVLAALEATVGSDDPRVETRVTRLSLSAGDTDALATRLRAEVPTLAPDTARDAATQLIAHVAAHPIGPDVAFAPIAHAIRLALRADQTRFAPRARAEVGAHGASWALVAATGGASATGLVMCGDAVLPTRLDERDDVTGGTSATVALGHCVATVESSAMRFRLGARAAELAGAVQGNVRVMIEREDGLAGLAGTIDGPTLRVNGATPSMARADLARIERELVAPLDGLGTRTFPPPTLSVPIPERRRDAAVAATRGIEGVDCTRATTGVRCSLESYESVERLSDAAFAMFASD